MNSASTGSVIDSAQYVIDFLLRRKVERPPKNLLDEPQPAGLARSPQSRSCAFIE
jgi:hypothetical protein